MERVITRFENHIGFLRSGNYGNPPSFFRYFGQLIVWMIIVIISKIGTTIILLVFEKWLAWIHAIMLLPFNWNATFKTVIVVGVYPVVVTTLLFLIQDGFIRFKGRKFGSNVKDGKMDTTIMLAPSPEDLQKPKSSDDVSVLDELPEDSIPLAKAENVYLNDS
jgi:hypothetical protein